MFPYPPFLRKFTVRVSRWEDESESCGKRRRTGEVGVGVEFPHVRVGSGVESSRFRYSEPPKVFHKSKIYESYILISSEPPKVDIKSPIYLFGFTGAFSDKIPISEVSL